METAEILDFAFTGDLLRPNRAGKRTTQSSNILWLYRLVAPVIQAASGRLKLTAETGDGGPLALDQVYEKSGVLPEAANWAGLFSTPSQYLKDQLIQRFKSSVAVGFELPDSFRSTFDEAGIPWIDIVVHPVRFLDDLLLGVAVSRHFQADLRALSVTDHAFPMAAGAIAAMAARRKDWRLEVPDRSALFVGQVKVDRSMIADGRLVGLGHYGKRLATALNGVRTVLYKPHPYETDDTVEKLLKSLVPDTRRIDSNAYALLSTPNLKTIVTISSSLGEEARYFGKSDVRYLAGPSTPVRYKNSPPEATGFWSVDNSILDPAFWRTLLAGVAPVSEALEGEFRRPRPDLLRMTLQRYWAYEEVVNDSIVRHSALRDEGAKRSLFSRLGKRR